MLRSTSAGARSILNRAKRPMAVAALMGSVGFAGASATTTAMAHPASGTLITCDPFGSGDRCFFTTSTRTPSTTCERIRSTAETRCARRRG